MTEVVYGGTERKEPYGMTTGISPSPALFTGFLLQLQVGSWRKRDEVQTIKAFFFFKGKYWYIIMPMGESPNRGMMQAKGCVILRRGTIQRMF